MFFSIFGGANLAETPGTSSDISRHETKPLLISQGIQNKEAKAAVICPIDLCFCYSFRDPSGETENKRPCFLQPFRGRFEELRGFSSRAAISPKNLSQVRNKLIPKQRRKHDGGFERAITTSNNS